MYRTNGQGNPLALATPMSSAAPNQQNVQPPPGPGTHYVASPQYPQETVHVGHVAPEPPQYIPVQAQVPAAPAPPVAPANPPAAPVAVPQPVQAVVPAPEPVAAVVDESASIQELQASCPGAPADFILQMLQQRATVQQAQTAFIQWQSQRLAQVTQQQPQPQQPQYVPQAPQAPQASAPQPNLGNYPVQPEPSETMPAIAGGGGSKAQWNSLVADRKNLLVQAGLNTSEAQTQAVLDVDKQHPGLREQAFGLNGPGAPAPQAPPAPTAA